MSLVRTSLDHHDLCCEAGAKYSHCRYVWCVGKHPSQLRKVDRKTVFWCCVDKVTVHFHKRHPLQDCPLDRWFPATCQWLTAELLFT